MGFIKPSCPTDNIAATVAVHLGYVQNKIFELSLNVSVVKFPDEDILKNRYYKTIIDLGEKKNSFSN